YVPVVLVRGGVGQWLRTSANQRTIEGETVMSSRNTGIMMRNGRLPTTTSRNSPVFRSDWTTNRLTPIGGVIIAASLRIMKTTPNQTGSKPTATTSGITIGAVDTIMEIGEIG